MHRERGISLLFVVLIGSIMLLTSVAAGLLALRLVQSASVRSESVRAQYAAEAAFNCVVYWLKQSVKDYFKAFDADGVLRMENGSAADMTCMSSPLAITGEVVSPRENRYTFTLTIDGDPVDVTVVRDMSVDNFRGTTTVMGRNMETASKKQLEKLQEYYFEWPSVKPSDIMFVVDRSASIEGDRSPLPASGDWETLVDSLTGAVEQLLPSGSPAEVGLVSYGGVIGGADDAVGVLSGGTVQPEIPLTANFAEIIGPTKDQLLDMMKHTDKANTNTSLGLAVAGAKLMGKAYQTGGKFEQAIADDADADADETDPTKKHLNLSGLAPDGGENKDRDDDINPDYIILVTDGQPNAIISHRSGTFDTVVVSTYGSQVVLEPSSPPETMYDPGDAKFFLTYAPDSLGKVEDNGYISVNTNTSSPAPNPYGLPDADNPYNSCNDNETLHPQDREYEQDLKNNQYGANDAPNVAMCNAEIIADALKEYGNITIGVIGIGSTEGTGYQEWLRDKIASKSADGTPIYQYARDFDQFMEALSILIADKLELNKMR